MTTGGNIVIPDAGNIGRASDTDAIAIASDGVVTFSQVPVLPDDTVATADIQDNAVTLAKMAGIARGKIIVGDASGDPSVLSAGSNGTFLKSDGTDLSFAAPSVALDDVATGDAAVTLATSAGNITIDAQGNDTDIILKGTDDSSDTTFLTIDGSDAGTASFNHDVKLANDAAVLEFDFIPTSDSISFKYVFGSEEYLEWVNSFNDAFVHASLKQYLDAISKAKTLESTS